MARGNRNEVSSTGRAAEAQLRRHLVNAVFDVAGAQLGYLAGAAGDGILVTTNAARCVIDRWHHPCLAALEEAATL
jgi:hypothetical protein